MADVKERPIPFSAPMVRAILNGRKTQTRRVVKDAPVERDGYLCTRRITFRNEKQVRGILPSLCPYGKPGDRLWVRESYVLQCDVEGEEPPHTDGRPIQRPTAEEEEYADWSWSQPHYRATDPTPDLVCTKESHKNCDICIDPWRNWMFMPRWASRITLEITEVRVQRLRDISEGDAKAEGADPIAEEVSSDPAIRYRAAFHSLWTSINGLHSWDANLWVWALTFRRVA